MRIGCAVLAALGVAASAAAQQPAADSPALVPIRQSLAMEIQEDGGARPSFARDIDYIALVARAPGILIHALQLYIEERSDKQVGATSSASGTTTLVSKGTVPKVLGFAPQAVGSHWSRSVQIDVIAINWQTHDVLLGECKWGAEAVDLSLLHRPHGMDLEPA